ncbi:glycosyltransferase family 2 protein [Rhodobacter sp. 24-YEA-8]|uniref:glycosyltransferase family 2 protein n=1 Tax=Rhodobacter sp. 24-YEA-8 TaxID=1884310 RepID=UPI0008943FC1|nr:glycosyltransferase family 2 protein [Rhodobacter sp. 24-YEA-8]SEC07868.1 Glycosyl transferase family 2 [Rhodobacter sp. 24-YEA-8]
MRILCATSVRDEGPYLIEWLAWHRLLGASDLLIASNDCRDGTDRLLDALARAGVLRHLPQPPMAALASAKGKAASVQWRALKAIWAEPERKAADWMLISDVDEFPVIHCGKGRFADLIAALPEETEAVALAWRLFGAGGIAGFEERPVTAQFLRSAPPDMMHPVAATMFKSLFRPAAFQRPGVHRPQRRAGQGPAAWVDGSGRVLSPVLSQDGRLSLIPLTGYRDLAEMHHYSLRSAAAFVVKSDRGLPNRSQKEIDLHYWVERNFNNQENTAALALAVPLAEEVAALMALPQVAALHEAALAWHRARFDQLIRQAGAYRLWAACLHAAGSYALGPAREMRLLQQYQHLTRNPDDTA